MGVIPCDRDGCSHIMCDDYILGYEYRICGECLAELRAWLAAKFPGGCGPREEIESAIRSFMETPKSTSSDDDDDDVEVNDDVTIGEALRHDS